ncbi:MAG TPA: hypothetical protein ENN13_02285 [Candidatus Altiarchaeales archaeon]|nr:hypothetical protein [Candidatus Altiarchaeales archaeon]
MEDEALKKKIEKYIREHNVTTIAVTDGKIPSAHSMYYVSHGLHIYLESDPQSQKIHVLRSNPNISLTIDEDYTRWSKIKGIQLFGKAKIVKEEYAPNLQKAFAEKFTQVGELGGILEHHVFVEVIPETIYFLDFEKGFGKREVLYLEDKKSILSW